MTKSTQWKHPLYKPSSARKEPQNKSNTNNNNNTRSSETLQNLNQTLPGKGSNINSKQQGGNDLNYTAPIRPSSSSGEQKQTKGRVKPAWNK